MRWWTPARRKLSCSTISRAAAARISTSRCRAAVCGSSRATSATPARGPRHRGRRTSSFIRRPSASRSAPKSRGWPRKCWSTAPSTCSRPRSAPACGRSSPLRRPRSTGWPRAFPTTETHHPYENRTIYGAAKLFNEGVASQLQRDVRPRLRGVALFQRLWPAHGRLRRLHRSADPVDGRDRRRHAAAHLRRRQQTRWISSHVEDIARANMLAAVSAGHRRVFNIGTGVETSLTRPGPNAAVASCNRRCAAASPRRAR